MYSPLCVVSGQQEEGNPGQHGGGQSEEAREAQPSNRAAGHAQQGNQDLLIQDRVSQQTLGADVRETLQQR